MSKNWEMGIPPQFSQVSNYQNQSRTLFTIFSILKSISTQKCVKMNMWMQKKLEEIHYFVCWKWWNCEEIDEQFSISREIIIVLMIVPWQFKNLCFSVLGHCCLACTYSNVAIIYHFYIHDKWRKKLSLFV